MSHFRLAASLAVAALLVACAGYRGDAPPDLVPPPTALQMDLVVPEVDSGSVAADDGEASAPLANHLILAKAKPRTLYPKSRVRPPAPSARAQRPRVVR